MTDIWVCATCLSVNRERNDRCYKCGAAKADGADAGPALRVRAAVTNRATIPYHSAALFALVASILILAVAAMGIVILIASLDSAAIVREQITIVINGGTVNEAAIDAQDAALTTPSLIRFVLLVAAVIAFAIWLNRVISNIPALGGGQPKTTPMQALIYPVIPIWNLVKVPGMVQEALYRVEPQAGGLFMVAFAWFGLVGSWIISFLGGIFLGIGLASRIVSVASTPGSTRRQLADVLQSSLDQGFALEIVTSALVAMGAVVLVVLILRIERRSAARDAEIRAVVLGAPTPQGS